MQKDFVLCCVENASNPPVFRCVLCSELSCSFCEGRACWELLSKQILGKRMRLRPWTRVGKEELKRGEHNTRHTQKKERNTSVSTIDPHISLSVCCNDCISSFSFSLRLFSCSFSLSNLGRSVFSCLTFANGKNLKNYESIGKGQTAVRFKESSE